MADLPELPEDDGPTISGANAGDRPRASPEAVDLDGDDGDETTAQAQPPAEGRDSRHDSLAPDEDEQTVQQAISRAAVSALVAPPRPQKPSAAALLPEAPTEPVTQPNPQTSAGASPASQASRVPTLPPPAPSSDPTLETDREPKPVTPDLEPIEDTDDETATAQRRLEIDSRKLPLTIPSSVEIRTIESSPDSDESDVETEVRPLSPDAQKIVPATLRLPTERDAREARPPSPRPAAGVPAPGAPRPRQAPLPADDDSDSVTTEARRQKIPASSEPHTPATSRSPKPIPPKPIGADRTLRSASPVSASPVVEPDELVTRPGVNGSSSLGVDTPSEPPTRPGVLDASSADVKPVKNPVPVVYDAAAEDDESVTTLAPAPETLASESGDDSITAQAPPVPAGLAAAATGPEPEPEGPTQKVKTLTRSAPVDSEVDSITAQAPGSLTNMLRGMAANNPAVAQALESVDDDESPQNRTAVMANAPVRGPVDEGRVGSALGPRGGLPPIRPTGPAINLPPQGARAVAAPQLQPSSESGMRARGAMSGEHGVVGVHDGRASGVGRARTHENGPPDPRAIPGSVEMFTSQPSLHDVQLKGPPYGLIVGIVLAVCVTIPVTLFIVLQRGDDAPIHTASTASPDFQGHVDAPRRKYDKSRKSETPAAVSASASSSSSRAPPRR